MSTVFGLQLAGGQDVVVKAREDGASGVFPKTGPAMLPPIESSAAFLTAYQEHRGRRFTEEEQEVAWAASLWTAAHDVRWEALHGKAPTADDALRAQAAERLRRANA
ncbi:hypothetical protein [Amycolatopsis keratiniphila]|uniref:hypothetical protein n=1 Tax=Amycolatopsis keratiniphila TaxID=129921 RepID=UPI003F4D648F